jgi:hypothetical protein
MKKVLFLLLLFGFISCTEESTSSLMVFRNKTSFVISVTPLREGQFVNNNSFILNAFDSLEIDMGIDGGFTNNGHNYSFGVVFCDSILVTIKDSVKVVHYNENTSGNSAYNIPFLSPRNLFNSENYKMEIDDLSRRYRMIKSYYEFIDNDFPVSKRENH